LAVGAGLVVVGSRRRPGDRLTWVVYGLAVASVGVGSGLFHGPAPPGARLVHDLSIVAAFGFIATFDLALLRGWSRSRSLAVYLGGLAALGALFAAVPDSSVPVTGGVLLLVVATEVLVARGGGRRPDGRFAGPLYWLAGGLLTVGLVVNLLFRTDAPFCDPDSLAQGHAGWHALTAVALGAWAVDGLRRRLPTT
jgi:hypothetical protein